MRCTPHLTTRCSSTLPATSCTRMLGGSRRPSTASSARYTCRARRGATSGARAGRRKPPREAWESYRTTARAPPREMGPGRRACRRVRRACRRMRRRWRCRARWRRSPWNWSRRTHSGQCCQTRTRMPTATKTAAQPPLRTSQPRPEVRPRRLAATVRWVRAPVRRGKWLGRPTVWAASSPPRVASSRRGAASNPRAAASSPWPQARGPRWAARAPRRWTRMTMRLLQRSRRWMRPKTRPKRMRRKWTCPTRGTGMSRCLRAICSTTTTTRGTTPTATSSAARCGASKATRPIALWATAAGCPTAMEQTEATRTLRARPTIRRRGNQTT
mmetsp:Transcript_33992/g.109822  ORF Transcript_33992/g.109822 Transcript_33992/m.109822 type:complete len:329 (-) Transcript_33992:422-1408(-)